MRKIELSLAFSENPRTRPILDGAIGAEGIDLMPQRVRDVGELFWRQLRFEEFDVSEMSLSSYLISCAHGNSPWVAIPVFTTRYFFQTWAYVHVDSGIRRPEDLKGKRVGVPEYQQTAALWTRGIWKHEFGVDPEDVEWHMERTEALSHGGATGFQPPKGVRLLRVPVEKSIAMMLATGELDAVVMYAKQRSLVDRTDVDLEQHPSARPLFPDADQEGVRYFRKTGIFPMNHTAVIRRSIVERHPWVALNLFQAFTEAKTLSRARMWESLEGHLGTGLISGESRRGLEVDPYAYGGRANRSALEAVTRYSHEQGLTPRVLALDEVFAAPCLDL